VFVGDNLQLGATIGFGFDGVTEESYHSAGKFRPSCSRCSSCRDIRPMAYFTSAPTRANMARAVMGDRYWGIGLGAVL
jgi:hypothetical protein